MDHKIWSSFREKKYDSKVTEMLEVSNFEQSRRNVGRRMTKSKRK